jgi:Recombinase
LTTFYHVLTLDGTTFVDYHSSIGIERYAFFANLCKKHHVLIITDEHIFDFDNPTRDDMGRFMNEAIAAKEYVRKQIRGKMLKNRTRKANMGRVANGMAPVGLMLDESRDNLVPCAHHEQVERLYGRYRALSADLAKLHHEIVNMAKRGEPLFLPDPSIDESTIRLDRVYRDGDFVGWTIKSRSGLKHVLSNPMYAGHLVFNKRVVKYNAHMAIVDQDNWQYAFEHISKYDLDGNKFERPARIARYSQQKTRDNLALLAGTRDDGRPVIDGLNGSHVYVKLTTNVYILRDLHKYSVNGYEGSIMVTRLDRVVADRILFWLQKSRERQGQTMFKATSKIEQATQPLTATSTIDSDLAQTTIELARVERALRTSQDDMDDETLSEHFASKKRLIKRKAELEHAKENEARIARERAQAARDIDECIDKWLCWDLEKRRQFIHLVTDAIILEKLENGDLRVTLVWSPDGHEPDLHALDIATIQRRPERVKWEHGYIHGGVCNKGYRSGT